MKEQVKKIFSLVSSIFKDNFKLIFFFLLTSIIGNLYSLITNIVFYINSQTLFFSGQICYYALLLLARLLLILFFVKRIKTKKESKDLIVVIVAAISLILIGVEDILLTQLIYVNGLILDGPGFIILFNGLIIIIQLIIALINFIKFRKSSDKNDYLYLATKYLSISDCLFLFYILFAKLIQLYGWINDPEILFANYLEGIVCGAITLLLALIMIIKYVIKIKNTKTLEENDKNSYSN